MSESHKPGRHGFALVIDLIRAIAWPAFAFTLLIGLWKPLRSLADVLPSLVSRSETITVSGVSLKIDKRLQRRITPEVSTALAKLGPDDLERLLSNEFLSWQGPGAKTAADVEYGRLIELGLFRRVEAAEFEERNKYGVKLTERGKHVRAFLFDLIQQLIVELKGNA